MFGLDDFDLRGSVLDCSAGASSFVAELAERGGRGTAVDPAYAMPRDELVAAAVDSLPGCNQMIGDNADRFVWDWYGSPERREEIRRAATQRFVDDYSQSSGRYVAGALPQLPVADGSHDLVLCSHLLFTWSNTLDADWHYAALTDMARVARREVRVYPLVVQGSGAAVPFFAELVARLREDQLDVETRAVPYRFQRGAEAMLIVAPRSTGRR